MTVNGLAGEIDWRETDVGLVARLGLKIIRSEVVADSVAERLRTLDPTLMRHRNARAERCASELPRSWGSSSRSVPSSTGQ
jgi:hypothetical protein